MYGPKAVGKSILISKCVDGKKGVVNVLISSVFSVLLVLSTKKGRGSPAVDKETMIDVLY